MLDDNKILCLSNGQRIKLNSDIHLLFEVGDLSVASPATISRCGMVCILLPLIHSFSDTMTSKDMQPSVLGWQPIVKSWIAKLPSYIIPALRLHLLSLFTKHTPPCLDAIRNQCELVIELVDSNLISSLCDLFSALLKDNPKAIQQSTVS